MTIHLPANLESPILAAVRSGRYASLNDAMADAASLLVQRLRQEQAQAPQPAVQPPADPLLGAWREDADMLDEIVEHAMRVREERPWRLAPGE